MGLVMVGVVNGPRPNGLMGLNGKNIWCGPNFVLEIELASLSL